MKAFKKAISRRGVLRGFGGGAALGLAKNIPDAANLSGVDATGVAGGVRGFGGSSAKEIEWVTFDAVDPEERNSVIRSLSGVLPDWKARELYQESKSVSALDMDIASHRSMSLAARVFVQRERQFERKKSAFFDVDSVWDRKRKEWLERFGLHRL